MTFRPDPTFYPSARLAMQGPPERLACVAALNPNVHRPDEMTVVDLDPGSKTYGQIISRLPMSQPGDELHQFGWNACSSALCPYAPHPHVDRRYLIVPGLRSSRIHVIDTTRSEKAADHEGDRSRRDRKAVWLLTHAYRALRTGRYLREYDRVFKR